MAETPRFMAVQRGFTAHIRAPEQVPCPEDVEERRMAVYRELLYNNVESFLANNFPVLRSLYDDTRWDRLARGFFAEHHSRTPLFLEIPQEFLHYLQHEREPQPDDPPFLLELAHYEWVELALAVSDADQDMPSADPNGDLLDGTPLVSPVAWALAYHFPVHHISPDFQPDEPGDQPTHLVVYRNREDEVCFMEINAVTARLLALLEQETPPNGRQALTQIAAELNHPQPEVVITGGLQTLQELLGHGVLIGTAT